MTRRAKVTREPIYTHCTRDGCGKPRRRPKGTWALEAWLTDEFCSTECAKAHHRVSVRETAEFVNAERTADAEFAEARA